MYITTSVLPLRDFLNLQCALNIGGSMRIEEDSKDSKTIFGV